MATSSFAGRHPVLLAVLVLVGLLVVGGGVAYFATDHGKALLPTLEQPTLNLSNITREKITGQMEVQMRNHAPITLKIDSLRYETKVQGLSIFKLQNYSALTFVTGALRAQLLSRSISGIAFRPL